MAIVGDVGYALITILRTGKPCTGLGPESRAEKVV
jgi:hypothetical protein